MRVNLVTGSAVSWVFADLVDRLRELVPADIVVTERPQPDADVFHFWRPQAAMHIEDLSRAVLTCHGFGCWHDGNPIYGPGVVRAFQRAHSAIVLNQMDASQLLPACETGGAQLHIIPHAVDAETFTLRPEHDQADKLCIGRVGRPYGPADDPRTGTECKGRATLHEIMGLLQEHRDEIQWLFLGAGWEQELAMARQLGYEAEFVLRTADNYPAAFVAAYHATDVFLVTSRAEGGPASLPEAMACGVWPVCTRVGMCPDLLGQIRLPSGPHSTDKPLVGDLYGVNDHNAAAAAITKLIGRRELLENARPMLRSFVAGWTWERWARAHADVYEAVASGDA